MKKSIQTSVWYALSVGFLILFLAPVIWRKAFMNPVVANSTGQEFVQVLLVGLCPLVAWFAFAGEDLRPKRKLAAWYVVLVGTAICEVIHYWVTDRGHYFGSSQFADNTTWQVYMHGPILDLDRNAIPHSYRFLPDAIVQFFYWLSGDFVISRIAYRLTFNALLLVAVYRLARTYVTDLFAAIAVAMVVAIYPITILKYAGQFVDPLSHLVIIACLLCLARGFEPAFGPILFVGLFAKESVIVLAACRLFYGGSRWRAAAYTAAYSAVSLLILVAIRRAVTHGHLDYGAISGVDFKHIPDNLRGYREWILMYVAIGAAVIPGAVLGWRYMDRPFQWAAAINIAAMVISSMMFSWLSEVRNMMPAFIVLIVISMVWLQKQLAGALPGIAAGETPRQVAATKAT